ncbi:hypothetical protein, partial [Kineococcus indalonis]|uniref:hypothetical protein n=1 Tax=Kineococcus indalonis TaxID=2696566 RepID=UPI001412716E
MEETGTALLIRAEAAYERSVRDPGSPGDAADLVAEARRAGDAPALVVALRAQGWCARHRLAGAEAKDHLDEAVRVARRHGLTALLTAVLTTRAAINQELGSARAARRDLQHARELGPSPALDLQQAVLLHNTGALDGAEALYRALLDAPATPPDIRVKAGNNLALVESQHGRHEAAVARLEALEGEAARVGPALVAVVEDSRAWATVQSGRLTEGLRLMERAAEAHRSAHLPLGEHHLERSDALVELRLLPEAADAAALALEDFRRGGVWLLAAEAQVRVARLALLGAPERAEAAAREAAELFGRQRRTAWTAFARGVEVVARTEAGRPGAADLPVLVRAARTLERAGIVTWAADAHLAAGRLAALLGRTGTALEALERAGGLCADGPALVRLKGRVARARAAQLTGRPGEVLAHCRAGLADLSRHRAALPTAELRARASGHGVELGQLGLGALLPTASPERVLRWLERTRAAALLTSEAPRTGGTGADLALLRGVHAELAAARAGDGAEPAELLERQKTLEERVRRATWVDPATHPPPAAAPTAAELRLALQGRVLVEYGRHRGDLLAVLVGPRRSRTVALGPAEALREPSSKLLFALRSLARDGGAPALLEALRATADAMR